MIHRMIAAGIALLGASCLAAPLAISAGVSGRISSGMNGHFRAPGMPLVNPGKPIPNLPSPQSGSFHQHSAFRSFRQHERFEQGTPLWWGYGPSDYPVAEVEPSQSQVYIYPQEFAERPRPPVLYQPGCRTEAVTVPSESGGQRTINITRCY